MAAMEEETPAYVRIGKGGEPELNYLREDLKLGYREYFDGPDGVILFTGTIGDEVISAGKILQERGLNPTIASLSQLDLRLMSHLKTICQGKFVMTVEEHVVAGGFGSMVRELLQTDFTNTRIISCGVEKLLEREVGSQPYLRGIYGLDAISLSQKFEESLELSIPYLDHAKD
jgi:transketolase C-terminal domain/subunit